MNDRCLLPSNSNRSQWTIIIIIIIVVIINIII